MAPQNVHEFFVISYYNFNGNKTTEEKKSLCVEMWERPCQESNSVQRLNNFTVYSGTYFRIIHRFIYTNCITMPVLIW